MESAELSSASSWLHWLSVIKYVGGAMVVLGVVAELLGDWFSEPLQKKLDDARKLEIAQLTTEGQRLTKESDGAKAAIAEANARALEAQLALERFKAPRQMTPELKKRLLEDVLPVMPKDRRPSVGAVPENVYNLQFADQIASVLGVDLHQAPAVAQVGPARGVVAKYVTRNERGKQFAEALAKALNDNGVAAGAIPGLMESLFNPSPTNPQFVPMDPTTPEQAWVVIVVGDKP